VNTPILTESLINKGNLFFPEAASTFASGVDNPFLMVFWLSVIFFVPILVVIAIFLVRYRRKTADQQALAQITHNTKLEIIWSVIPLILLIIIFWWGFNGYLKMSVPPKDSLEVRVTARKWSWSFNNLQDVIETTGELVVPVNQPVKLIMSSDDVVHSLYIPNMRVKKDVVPNRYTTLWFEAVRTGNFQIFCTEYCGDGHSSMLAVLRVLSESDYDRWVLAQKKKMQQVLPLNELGEISAQKYGCLACHSVDGNSGVGPTWKDVYGSKRLLADGSSVTVDDNYIRESITNPSAKVVKGYPPAGMPVFAGKVSDKELAGLAEYIKTLGNKK